MTLRETFLTTLFAAILVASSRPALADCPLWENLKKARQHADDTAAAFEKVLIPAELEKKIELIIARKVIENPGINIKTAIDEAEAELSVVEKAQIAPWLVARKLRETADQNHAAAEKAYREEMNKKDAALKEAEKAFETEQQWLEAEKQAIKNIPRDDAYLDRVSQITKRLRAAYEKMRRDLGGFRECFPDVRRFLDDKEDRLKKIDAVDREIARRRGVNPGDPADPNADNAKAGDTQQVVPGEPPPPGPLGDVWVCDGPTVSPKQGKLTSVSATGFTYVREVDGKKYSAGIIISKTPPLRVRIHERVEIVMTAFGDPKAAADGAWLCNNTIAGQLPCSNGCSNIPKYKAEGDSSTGTVRFYFGAGLDPFIRMYGGEYDSRDGTRVDIIWKYRKEGGK